MDFRASCANTENSIKSYLILVNMIILGIETSCDETAAAVIDGRGDNIKILSDVVYSQINIHKKYCGVVPEAAAREHVLKIIPVIDRALKKAGIKPKEAKKKINALAATVGPGLITSLLVGVETAKALSYVWQIPVVAMNHIEAHIYANFLENEKKEFPAVILTVSGGHTMLVLMRGHGQYKILGETKDDAAGEAFDKAGQILHLGYPGGPLISRYGAQADISKNSGIVFPRPMIKNKSYDFSFSGLKTALLYAVKKDPEWKKKVPAYCREFEQAVIDVLINKTIKAARDFQARSVMLSGGVSANLALRSQMSRAVKENLPAAKFFLPAQKFTTDNAAMVAAAGYFKAQRGEYLPWQKLLADCNLVLK